MAMADIDGSAGSAGRSVLPLPVVGRQRGL
jgi:hypothetical protein